MKDDFQINEKFKEFTDQGISAPQVLTFLDNISVMLRAVAGDIEKAIHNIETNAPAADTKEESTITADAE
tara:strand:+ start:749 stop:958 length:210 start_codon:yes stop_codon:yes gene_type:complete